MQGISFTALAAEWVSLMVAAIGFIRGPFFFVPLGIIMFFIVLLLDFASEYKEDK